MVYQHVNKRTAMLSLTTSHIAHYCNQLNQVTLPISIPRFKSIIFYKNSSIIKLFLQNNAKFLSVEGRAPRPPAVGGFATRPTASGSCKLCEAVSSCKPQTLETAPPPLRISCYAPKIHYISTTLCERFTPFFCS